MTKSAANTLTSHEPKKGELEEALSTLSSDPEFVAEELALAITEDIANAMEVEGISKAELAKRIGSSRSYVSRIMDAPPNMTLRSISKIGLALGLTPEVRLRRPIRRVQIVKSSVNSVRPMSKEARHEQYPPTASQLSRAD